MSFNVANAADGPGVLPPDWNAEFFVHRSGHVKTFRLKLSRQHSVKCHLSILCSDDEADPKDEMMEKARRWIVGFEKQERRESTKSSAPP
jgi:hypothetical protein